MIAHAHSSPALVTILALHAWLAQPVAAQDAPAPVVLADQASMDPAIADIVSVQLAKVQANPGSGEAHAELGLAYEANTLFNAAARCYANAALLMPDRKEWIYRLAVAQHATGDTEAALRNMRTAAEAFKNTPVIQARLGSLLLEVDDIEGAEAAWKQAIAAEASQPGAIEWAESRVGLAQTLTRKERWVEAMNMLFDITQEQPDYRHARFLLGLCYAEQGRADDAAVEFEAGVNAWPRLPPDPHQPRLDAYSAGYFRKMMSVENMMMAGDYERTLAMLKEMLEAAPGDHYVLHLLGRVYQRSGDIQSCIETLRLAEAANPSAVDTKIELGSALLNSLASLGQDPAKQQEAIQEALQKASEAIRLAPNLGRPHYFYGVALTFTINPQAPDPQALNAALNSMSTALQLGCPEPEIYERLAMLYAQTGRAQEMVKFAQANAYQKAGSAGAFVFLAKAHFTVGNKDAALAAATRAFDLAPRDPIVVMFYAQAQVELGQLAQAVRTAEWLVNIRPNDTQARAFHDNVVSVAATGALPGADQPPQPGPEQKTDK